MLSSGERHPQNSIAIVCALHQLPALALLLHTSQVWLVGHGLPARSSAASSVCTAPPIASAQVATPTPRKNCGRAGQGGRTGRREGTVATTRSLCVRRDRSWRCGSGSRRGHERRRCSARCERAGTQKKEAISVGSTVMADLRSAPPLPMLAAAKNPSCAPS